MTELSNCNTLNLSWYKKVHVDTKWKLKHFHLLLLDENCLFQDFILLHVKGNGLHKTCIQHSITCIAWSIELALILIWMNLVTVEGVPIDSPTDQHSMTILGEKSKYMQENCFSKNPVYLRSTQVLGRSLLITPSVQSLTNSGSVYEIAELLHSSAYIKSSYRLCHLYSRLGSMQSH